MTAIARWQKHQALVSLLRNEQLISRAGCRLDTRRLPASQHRVALVNRALIDGSGIEPVLLAHLAAQAVGGERVGIGDLAYRIRADATLGHKERRLRDR